jgi:hypothetical protein
MRNLISGSFLTNIEKEIEGYTYTVPEPHDLIRFGFAEAGK